MCGNEEVSTDDNSQVDLSQWMTNLDKRLTTIPINKLAIPGSHDSGTYCLDASKPINVPYRVPQLPCVKHIVINWAKTQGNNFTSQLNNGVRYFDMRSGYLRKSENISEDPCVEDILSIHTAYGLPIINMLNEIQTFLTSNPHEVVIVDFNQFYHFTNDIHNKYAEKIKRIFGNGIYENNTKGKINMSLSDFWKAKKQVLIRYCDNEIAKNYNLFPKCSFYSKWFDTSCTTELTQHLTENIAPCPCEDEKINVSQAILSPKPCTIICHLSSTLESVLAKKCSVAVKDWLYPKECGKMLHEEEWQWKNVGVVICDFTCEYDCPQAIIEMNNLYPQNVTYF